MHILIIEGRDWLVEWEWRKNSGLNSGGGAEQDFSRLWDFKERKMFETPKPKKKGGAPIFFQTQK